jgi:hypothetical protein
MTRGSILVLFMLVFSSMVYVADEASGTASSFTEIGSTAFDVTTNGNFLSVHFDGERVLIIDRWRG